VNALYPARIESWRAMGFLIPIKARMDTSNTFAVVESDLSILSHRLSSSEPPAAGSILAIFAAARRLRGDAHAGTTPKPLRGKNLALLFVASPGGEASALHRAALELGVRVAEVRFAEPTRSSSARDEIRALARMLGRMYDAIDCGTLAPATVRQIERAAGVPVYEGLGLDSHPVRALADLMTIHENPPPVPDASILYLGDPQTTRGRTFLTAARKMGFTVRVEKHRQTASKDATFVVDATCPPHWSLHGPSSPLDEARRSENHRCMMQTVLLDTIVKA
jgi:ornithine carbamoyltransferase